MAALHTNRPPRGLVSGDWQPSSRSPQPLEQDIYTQGHSGLPIHHRLFASLHAHSHLIPASPHPQADIGPPAGVHLSATTSGWGMQDPLHAEASCLKAYIEQRKDSRPLPEVAQESIGSRKHGAVCGGGACIQ